MQTWICIAKNGANVRGIVYCGYFHHPLPLCVCCYLCLLSAQSWPTNLSIRIYYAHKYEKVILCLIWEKSKPLFQLFIRFIVSYWIIQTLLRIATIFTALGKYLVCILNLLFNVTSYFLNQDACIEFSLLWSMGMYSLSELGVNHSNLRIRSYFQRRTK